MKKFFILLVLMIISVSVFADDANYLAVQKSLESNNPDFNLVKDYSLNLSLSEKLQLVEVNKIDTTLPFLLNTFVGFGVGSFVQGDNLTGGISLGIDLAAGGLLFMATTIQKAMIHNIKMDIAHGGTGNHDGIKSQRNAANTFYLIGGIALLGNRIYQAIRPFNYAKSKNNKLNDAVFSTAIVPVMEGNNLKIALAGSYQF